MNYSSNYQDQMMAKPRPSPKHLGGRDKLKTAWEFKTSVFRDYKADTDPIRRQCFEQDWKSCKLEGLIKNGDDKAQLKTLLYKNYKGFRETYKHYSGVNPIAGLPAISVIDYSDMFFTNCPGMVDNKSLGTADTDLEFISTNAGSKGKRNPVNNLCRHNIMEVWCRIAKTKYFKSGEATSYTEAM